MKKNGLQPLPASGDGPALGLIRNTLASVIGFADRHQDVGEDRADHEVDLVALDELLGLADGHVGFQLVVLHDDAGRQAAELAARVLDAQIEAVAQLAAEHRLRARTAPP